MDKLINILAKNKFILIGALFFLSFSCNKNDSPQFSPDFSMTFTDQNHVRFENLSLGEYYSLIWDFGNGQGDTTTDKNQSYLIYYPDEGDYDVSLKLLNFSGENKSITKTLSIENSDLTVAFTASISQENPNIVYLVNTTVGQFDSSKWTYSGSEIMNQIEVQAYFPLAGNYPVQLDVYKDGSTYSDVQNISIAQNDPNYNPDWTLVWNEEFDYTGLPDASKWNMETGGNGWGNGELQYYTNSINNAKVENGELTITAREESIGGRDYSSARITTQNKYDFKYGKIEARMKLPYGKGMWPAFWMLGANFNSVGWPACGEIDIMELVGGNGNDNTVHATIHWENDGSHASYGQSYSLSSGIFADDYHIFSAEWNEQEIKAYVDGNLYYVADLSPAQLSEFHENFFIILNLAVGGSWPGSPDASTVFPQTLKVDYVRVYQFQ